MPYRTITINVAEVVDGGTKAEFYKELRECLELSRSAANWVLAACYREDKDLMTGEKLGTMPKLNVYQVINDKFVGCTGVAASLSRDTHKKYLKMRWELRCGRVSVPNMRSVPWCLLKKEIKHESREGVLLVRIKLKRYWTVRICGGKRHWRHVMAATDAFSRQAVGDSKVWINKDKVAVIGLACKMPERERKESSGTMMVATSMHSLLVAARPGDERPFVFNGDDARRWDAEKEKRYQRLRQDKKCDKLMRRKANEQMEFMRHKYNSRVTTLCHTAAKVIVEHAICRGFAEIKYDETVKSFVKRFPWFKLKTYLKDKATAAGITFTEVVHKDRATQDINKPHVYFRYSPLTHRIKIGETTVGKRRHDSQPTDSSDRNLVVVAVFNCKKGETKEYEKQFHAMFSNCRPDERDAGEWFEAEGVLEYLREAGWTANTGNRSQLMQYLDAKYFPSRAGHLHAHREGLNQRTSGKVLAECVVNVRDHSTCGDAPEVTDRSGMD